MIAIVPFPVNMILLMQHSWINTIELNESKECTMKVGHLILPLKHTMVWIQGITVHLKFAPDLRVEFLSAALTHENAQTTQSIAILGISVVIVR